MQSIPSFYDFPNERKRVFSFSTSLPGGNSEWEPPDSISNSEVKTLSADDSVGSPHVKVGHCQAFIEAPWRYQPRGFFCLSMSYFYVAM